MSTPEESWKEIGDQLGSMALKIKLHVEEAQSASSDDLKRSLDGLSDAIDNTLQALRTVVKDPALEQDVRDLGQRVNDALFNTFSSLGNDVGQIFKREGQSQPDAE